MAGCGFVVVLYYFERPSSRDEFDSGPDPETQT